ncbi:MAG: 50S ribosomal protein L28 [Eubacteriales bacterium]
MSGVKEVFSLARKCIVCGKGITVGIKLSHSHIRTKRTWAPNLQRVKALIDGTPQKVLVCTRCLRSGKVQRAI